MIEKKGKYDTFNDNRFLELKNHVEKLENKAIHSQIIVGSWLRNI